MAAVARGFRLNTLGVRVQSCTCIRNITSSSFLLLLHVCIGYVFLDRSSFRCVEQVPSGK